MYIVALKALIFVGGLTFLSFFVARIAFADMVGRARFANWAVLYFSITICVFAVSNFWICLFLIFCVTVVFGSRETNIPALFALLILSVPAKGTWIGGFGIVNNLLFVTPVDIIQAGILTLMVFRTPDRNDRNHGGKMADAFLMIYALVVMVLSFRDTTITNGLRICVVFALSTFPAYLIFSRMRWTAENMRVTTIALLIPMITLSSVAVFEVITNWHFYATAVSSWGVVDSLISIKRGGFLRAYGTVMGPIAFGSIIMVGFALAPAVLKEMKNKPLGQLGFLALSGGILAAFSRAPWIGTGFVFILHAFTDKKVVSSLSRLLLVGVAFIAVLAVTPFGSAVLDSIPGMGDDGQDETISYRQELLRTGIQVVRDNPVFGSTSFLERDDLEQLRQGQGIIDLVNTYLDIAMRYGLVGLFLFIGVKFIALVNIWRSIGRARIAAPALAPYCQAYFAALGSLMFVLFTTTNTIGQFEQVIWLVVGASIGLTRRVNEAYAAFGQEGTEIENAPVDEPSMPGTQVRARPPARPPAADPVNLPPHLRQYVKRPE